jgi:hypothetical protein
MAGSTAIANVNGDTVIDQLDLAAVMTGFGMQSGATSADGDADADGDVDLDDYLSWEIQYGLEIDPAGWLTNALEFDVNNLSNGQVIVSSAVDENDGDYSLGNLSIREALNLTAHAGVDAIAFANAATGVIDLTAGPLVLAHDVFIAGPGANLLSIDGTGQSGVFRVNSGVTASITGLTAGNASGTGISNNSGNLTLIGVEVVNNSSSGVSSSGGALTILNSTIAENSNSNVGGGVHLASGSALIANTTISNNSANMGGGIFSFASGGVEVSNSTITANRGYMGSGIYSPTSLVLRNSIVANNLTPSGTPTSSDFSGAIGGGSGFNLIGVGSGFTNGVNGNIVLGYGQSAGLTALADHGGPTRTHALLDGSAAIDAGSDAVATALGLTADQRGEDRIEDGNDDLFDRVDIGAFELAADEYFGSL